jgi:hypothetical protein
MKNCTYCGRENADEAMHCVECGTESVAERPAREPRDYKWLKVPCICVGGAIFVVLLYLLSFGPVMSYTGTVISKTTATYTNGFAAQGATAITITYPMWVATIYHPLFALSSRGDDDVFSELYWQYLHLWEKSVP